MEKGEGTCEVFMIEKKLQQEEIIIEHTKYEEVHQQVNILIESKYDCNNVVLTKK